LNGERRLGEEAAQTSAKKSNLSVRRIRSETRAELRARRDRTFSPETVEMLEGLDRRRDAERRLPPVGDRFLEAS
jgi:hypothetical protein